MRTDKQIEASRLNGAKSRGPVTPEGKRRAARYGTRNGLLASSFALQTENANDLRDLLNDLSRQYQPATPFECVLVESLGLNIWKQMRYRTASTVAIDLQINVEAQNLPEYDHNAAAANGVTIRNMAETGRGLDMMERQERLFERQYHRTVKLLMDIQHRRKLDPDQSGPGLLEPDEAAAPEPDAASPTDAPPEAEAIQFVALNPSWSPSLNPQPAENTESPLGSTSNTRASADSQPPFADSSEPAPGPQRPTQHAASQEPDPMHVHSRSSVANKAFPPCARAA